MTLFEKKFLLYCVDSMIAILSDKEQLAKAICAYTENNSNHQRFQYNHAIPVYETWTNKDLLNFSSAVFEATARANERFCTNFESAKKVSHATSLWSVSYLRLLALDTDFNDRLESVKTNCSQVRAAIEREIPTDSAQTTSEYSGFTIHDHPYTFFSTVTAGLIVATAAAVVLLKS